MVNPDLRQLMKGHTKRYSLVMAVAKRARDIVEDANEKGEIMIEKPVSIALEEIETGDLTYDEGAAE